MGICLSLHSSDSLSAATDTTFVSLSPQVPAAKKSIERLLYVLRQFFEDSNLSDAISTKKLRHKGADGNTQLSQLYPEEFDTQLEEGEEPGEQGEDQGSEESEVEEEVDDCGSMMSVDF